MPNKVPLPQQIIDPDAKGKAVKMTFAKLGQYLADCRKEQRISQVALSKMIGKSKAHVYEAEHMNKGIRLRSILAICKALDVELLVCVKKKTPKSGK